MGDFYQERQHCAVCGRAVDWSRKSQNSWFGIDFYRGWESMSPEDQCMICEVCIGPVKETLKKVLPKWDRWDQTRTKNKRHVRNIKKALDLK